MQRPRHRNISAHLSPYDYISEKLRGNTRQSPRWDKKKKNQKVPLKGIKELIPHMINEVEVIIVGMHNFASFRVNK